jgi:membrane protease YdiL (CAAX protease family)
VRVVANVNENIAAVNRWGFWATSAWAVVAFLVGQFAALAAIMLWRSGQLYAVLDTPYDGILVTLFILISNPISVAVLWLAVRLAKSNAVDYLALHWPNQRDVIIGLIVLVGIIALSDALLYVSGHALVTTFQTQSYSTALAEGWLPAMMFAAIVAAPAGEEIMFRGFLFGGFARSEHAVWPAIVAISILWAGLHIQYDWTGVLQIFVIGIFLGWMRWRSGSTLLTLLLHTLFNLEGTLETVLQMRFFS